MPRSRKLSDLLSAASAMALASFLACNQSLADSSAPAPAEPQIEALMSHTVPELAAGFDTLPTTFALDGTPFVLNTQDHGTLQVVPVRFEPHKNKGFMATSFLCGVVLRSGKENQQSLVTVGKGETETVSCDGLKGISTQTNSDGETLIGLLYTVRSPNTRYSALTVISWSEAGNAWSVLSDIERDDIVGSAPESAIAALASMLPR